MARHSTHWKSAELIPSIEQKYLNLLQDGNDENQILTGSEATSTRRLSRVGFLYGDFPLKRMASDRRTASSHLEVDMLVCFGASYSKIMTRSIYGGRKWTM
ncbi:uncharacterized protein LOC133650215 isoform X4 [Entelurus aequoreus]|uniref:uncharacterized protein LOC133650215 isoform X4 n=1 Tax=Entelurus aequoreus TaxID=161455 RepID=UPI002B1E86F4|nr:uncharacterized protein LOC133650215 isoform X4 [Entelurus aequoreus]